MILFNFYTFQSFLIKNIEDKLSYRGIDVKSGKKKTTKINDNEGQHIFKGD